MQKNLFHQVAANLWPCASMLWHFLLGKIKSNWNCHIWTSPPTEVHGHWHTQSKYLLLPFLPLPGYSWDQLGPALHNALSGWVQQSVLPHSWAICSAGSNQDLQHYCHFQQQQIPPLVFWTAPWKAMLPAANLSVNMPDCFLAVFLGHSWHALWT